MHVLEISSLTQPYCLVTAHLELYQRCRNAGLLKHVEWEQMTQQPQGRPRHRRRGYSKIEGHALCVHQNRYIVCGGGWADSGLTTDVQIFDTKAPPESREWQVVRTRGDSPPVTYGIVGLFLKYTSVLCSSLCNLHLLKITSPTWNFS